MPVSRPAVSQHLTVLRTAGLVSEHREGTRRIYRLEAAGIDRRLIALGLLIGFAGLTRREKSPVPPDAPKDGGGKKKHGKKRAGRK